MRTLVDFPEGQVVALDQLAKQNKQSRAALIRLAVDDFLKKHQRNQSVNAFGLWGDQKVDGLDYQQQARGEW